jgi:hypothetical protein
MRAAPWKLAAAAAAIGAALAMSAVLGAFAIQQRVLGPPNVEIALGPARLAAFTTREPSCRAPRSRLGSTSFCTAAQSIYSTDQYFVVWYILRSRRGAVTFEQADRLLVMRLAERR